MRRRNWKTPELAEISVRDACGYNPTEAQFGPLAPGIFVAGPLPNPEPAVIGPQQPTGCDVAAGPLPPYCDIALKESISRIGKTAHGLPLYTFRYKGRDGLYQGVMAQDVLKVMPEAVTTDPQGFYRVDYAMLGIEFRRLD